MKSDRAVPGRPGPDGAQVNGVVPDQVESVPDQGDSTPDQGASTPSRAGRDLRAAIGVGVGLGALALVSLLTIHQLFIGVVAAAVVVATIELTGALRRAAGIQVALVPVLVGGQAMIWLSWPWHRDAVLASFVVTIMVVMVWRFRGGADGYLRDVAASIFTVAYVPFFAAFAAMLVEP